MKICILFLLAILIQETSTAQSFSKYIGKSSSYLIKSLGNPEISKQNGDGYILQFTGNNYGEKLTYQTKLSKVILAIQSFPGLSLRQAKNKRDEMILLYMSQGYVKQGTQAGLTILKKGEKMLSVGYINDFGSTYVTLITAYN